MKNYPKEKPEIEQIPKIDREREIPPDFIPEPKKREPVPVLPEEDIDEN